MSTEEKPNFNDAYDGEDYAITVSNLELKGMKWKPEGDPKFIYVFVHGLGAYVTFKKDFFYDIMKMGGVVYGTDHIGHGRSPGARVSCTIDEIIEETQKTILHAKDEYPELPVLLHGHSMGGLTVLSLAIKDPEFATQNVKAIIAEAPWISECPQRKLNIVMRGGVRALNYVMPNFQIAGGVDFFSDDLDKDWVEMTKKNPLYEYNLTPRLYVSVMDWQWKVREEWKKWPTAVPLLFLQGLVDPLVDAKQSEPWIQQLVEDKDIDATYKLYETGSHVMLKSNLRANIIDVITQFTNEKLQLK